MIIEETPERTEFDNGSCWGFKFEYRGMLHHRTQPALVTFQKPKESDIIYLVEGYFLYGDFVKMRDVSGLVPATPAV